VLTEERTRIPVPANDVIIEMRMADDALEQSHQRGIIISGETIGVSQTNLDRTTIGGRERIEVNPHFLHFFLRTLAPKNELSAPSPL
jgi:hypothetical protein